MRLDNGLGTYKEFGARRMLLATFNDLAKADFEQALAIINVDNVITKAPKAQTPFGLLFNAIRCVAHYLF